MPTGYTEDIIDGITFRQYALKCSRAFGACIDMRDAPGSATIPDEFKPSDYHQKELKKAQADMKRWASASARACARAAANEYEAARNTKINALARIEKQRAAYNQMLCQVRSWIAPSDDHARLKEFMAAQIIDSIKWDCDNTFWLNRDIERQTPEQFRNSKIAKAAADMAYHAKEYEQEVERCAARSRWVKQLKESLACNSTG